MSKNTIRVLLVDDDEDDFLMLRDHLSEVAGNKYPVTWAASYDAGKTALLKTRT